MLKILECLNWFVWGVPALLLIIGVGVYLSLRVGFPQLRLFPEAWSGFWRRFRRNGTDDDKSSYRALCTALAATVGTGNVAGVAGAIAIGGPGAIFWMWICAFLGMVIKFGEATLSVRYKRHNEHGEPVGGPMYMIERGMPKSWRWLASLYSFFGVVAAFGVGNATQMNAVIGSVNGVIVFFGGMPGKLFNFLMGLLLALLTLAMLLGGARRIGAIAERLVPIAAVGYILLCLIVLTICRRAIPNAFCMIFRGAFSPRGITGGVVVSAFVALRVGASRGVFTNEAGMGTAAIAHSTSEVANPVSQGLMGIMEVFLDTILICTLTALVILCSGVDIEYGVDTGVLLTTAAFSRVLGSWVVLPIAVAMCCFAVATVLGWGLYGIRCAQYLFGEKAWKSFVYFQAVVVVISSVLQTAMVWTLAETVNGLMVIPNLIALVFLSPELRRLTREYWKGNLDKTAL